MYEQHEGDMNAVYEHVMLSNVLEDDERFRKIIDEAIKNREVPGFHQYLRESKKSKSARIKTAKAETGEAEEYAKELGVHDKLFGGGKKAKVKGKKGDEADLAALIQSRQKGREGFLDDIISKYGGEGNGKGKGKGKKRPVVEDEPDEAAFQAAAARLKTGKAAAAEGKDGRSARKKSRK